MLKTTLPRIVETTSNVCWLFDVDGTLTPSQGAINPGFQEWFFSFAQRNKVFLVTGGDYAKSVKQLGEAIMGVIHTSFNCTGNSVWVSGQEVYRAKFELPADAKQFLLDWLRNSRYPLRCAPHLEIRAGMANFSIVGRGADPAQRLDYFEWDRVHQERQALAKQFVEQFPGLSCQVGGETGVDIFPRDKDKRQVLAYFERPVFFFGDRMEEGGNDYSLARAIAARNDGSRAYPVQGWEATWRLLQTIEAAEELQR